MNDKQQLQAMGEHQAEQHMCMAKQIEDLQARLQECANGATKMQEQRDALAKQVLDLTEYIANNLTAKLGLGGIEVTETVRTAPVHIWLQVGDQSHYHSEPFPSDTGEVTWCADSVAGCEVPYVRADLACEAKCQLKQLEAANRQIAAMAELLLVASNELCKEAPLSVAVRELIGKNIRGVAPFPPEKTEGDYEQTEQFDGPDPYSIGHMDGWNDFRRAALAGELPDHIADASKMVPEGWQMVPIELTRAMREAFHDAHEEWESGDNWYLDCPDHQWSAMLAAAPKPEQPDQRLTVENAPVGTIAPAVTGGRWYRTELGWKWNGPNGSGGTFPRPGGDWNGKLIAPKPEPTK